MSTCANCGSSTIDYDVSAGHYACTSCGAVTNDNNMTSELTFAENAGGATSVVGQFLSRDGRTVTGTSGMPREARDITLQTGKKKIQNLITQLSAATGAAPQTSLVEQAHRLFSQALTAGYARGRRTIPVLCGCIYIASVRIGEPYMLIDLSEVTELNVYELADCATQLARNLGIQLIPNDPSIFIQRYATRLHFGAQTHQIVRDALKILKLMELDWITIGRRSNGLSAAALLLSARAHGFHPDIDELADLAKINPSTINTRLTEISNSPHCFVTLSKLRHRFSDGDAPLTNSTNSTTTTTTNTTTTNPNTTNTATSVTNEAHLRALLGFDDLISPNISSALSSALVLVDSVNGPNSTSALFHAATGTLTEFDGNNNNNNNNNNSNNHTHIGQSHLQRLIQDSADLSIPLTAADPPSFQRSVIERTRLSQWRRLLLENELLAEILIQNTAFYHTNDYGEGDLRTLSEMSLSKLIQQIYFQLRQVDRFVRSSVDVRQILDGFFVSFRQRTTSDHGYLALDQSLREEIFNAFNPHLLHQNKKKGTRMEDDDDDDNELAMLLGVHSKHNSKRLRKSRRVRMGDDDDEEEDDADGHFEDDEDTDNDDNEKKEEEDDFVEVIDPFRDEYSLFCQLRWERYGHLMQSFIKTLDEPGMDESVELYNTAMQPKFDAILKAKAQYTALENTTTNNNNNNKGKNKGNGNKIVPHEPTIERIPTWDNYLVYRYDVHINGPHPYELPEDIDLTPDQKSIILGKLNKGNKRFYLKLIQQSTATALMDHSKQSNDTKGDKDKNNGEDDDADDDEGDKNDDHEDGMTTKRRLRSTTSMTNPSSSNPISDPTDPKSIPNPNQIIQIPHNGSSLSLSRYINQVIKREEPHTRVYDVLSYLHYKQQIQYNPSNDPNHRLSSISMSQLIDSNVINAVIDALQAKNRSFISQFAELEKKHTPATLTPAELLLSYTPDANAQIINKEVSNTLFDNENDHLYARYGDCYDDGDNRDYDDLQIKQLNQLLSDLMDSHSTLSSPTATTMVTTTTQGKGNKKDKNDKKDKKSQQQQQEQQTTKEMSRPLYSNQYQYFFGEFDMNNNGITIDKNLNSSVTCSFDEHNNIIAPTAYEVVDLGDFNNGDYGYPYYVQYHSEQDQLKQKIAYEKNQKNQKEKKNKKDKKDYLSHIVDPIPHNPNLPSFQYDFFTSTYDHLDIKGQGEQNSDDDKNNNNNNDNESNNNFAYLELNSDQMMDNSSLTHHKNKIEAEFEQFMLDLEAHLPFVFSNDGQDGSQSNAMVEFKSSNQLVPLDGDDKQNTPYHFKPQSSHHHDQASIFPVIPQIHTLNLGPTPNLLTVSHLDQTNKLEFYTLVDQAVSEIKLWGEECDCGLDDIDDADIDELILSEEEYQQRQAYWTLVLARTHGISRQPKEQSAEHGEGRKRARSLKEAEERKNKEIDFVALYGGDDLTGDDADDSLFSETDTEKKSNKSINLSHLGFDASAGDMDNLLSNHYRTQQTSSSSYKMPAFITPGQQDDDDLFSPVEENGKRQRPNITTRGSLINPNLLVSLDSSLSNKAMSLDDDDDDPFSDTHVRTTRSSHANRR